MLTFSSNPATSFQFGPAPSPSPGLRPLPGAFTLQHPICFHIPTLSVPPAPSGPQDFPSHQGNLPKEKDASAPPGAATTAAEGGPGAGRT